MSNEAKVSLNVMGSNIVQAAFKKFKNKIRSHRETSAPIVKPKFTDPKSRFIDDLYKKHWNDLCGWLYRRYGSGPPEPEDIAQSAFVKIAQLEKVNGLMGESANARAYLFTTAVNTALMAIRANATRDRFIENELKKNQQILEEISPERIYSSKQYFEKLMILVEELPKKQQALVIRHRLRGQTYDEISKETGWSPADISRQLNQAMATIEDALYAKEGKKDKKT